MPALEPRFVWAYEAMLAAFVNSALIRFWSLGAQEESMVYWRGNRWVL